MANPDAAFSKGNLARELVLLRKRVAALETRRTLESASIGRGGLRVKGGAITILDADGNVIMELSTDGLTLEGLLAVLGNIVVSDGAIRADNADGTRIFEVKSDPAEIFMDKSLISSLALEILGEAISSADAPANEVLGDTAGSWVDLTGGPEITGVEVGDSGRALVMTGADISAAPTGENNQVDAFMSFEVSGETSVAPGVYDALRVAHRRGDGDSLLHPSVTAGATRVHLATGLNAGTHTFTAKYRVSTDSAFDEANYLGRNLTVIPF